jgi:hypothetical protein
MGKNEILDPADHTSEELKRKTPRFFGHTMFDQNVESTRNYQTL